MNREKDARQFAQPIVQRIMSPLITSDQMVKRYDKGVVRTEAESKVLELGADVDATLHKLDAEIREVTPSRFAYIKLGCEKDGVNKAACSKMSRKIVKNLMDKVRAYKKTLQTKVKTLKATIKSTKTNKRDKLKEIKQNIVANPTEYRQYKKTPFFAIKDTCSKTVQNIADIMESIQNQPIISDINNEIQEHRNKLDNLEGMQKRHRIIHRLNLNKMTKKLKMATNELQYNRIVNDMNMAEDAFAQESKNLRADIIRWKGLHQKSIKQLKNAKKLVIEDIRKTLKAELKVKKADARQTRKEEIILKNALGKSGELFSTMNDTIKEYVNEDWIRPSGDEIPARYKMQESGAYF